MRFRGDAIFTDEKSPNAVKLWEYCWFITACHFCLRASEIQASLKKDDVVFNGDGSGAVTFEKGSKEEEALPEKAVRLPELLDVACLFLLRFQYLTEWSGES